MPCVSTNKAVAGIVDSCVRLIERSGALFFCNNRDIGGVAAFTIRFAYGREPEGPTGVSNLDRSEPKSNSA